MNIRKGIRRQLRHTYSSFTISMLELAEGSDTVASLKRDDDVLLRWAHDLMQSIVKDHAHLKRHRATLSSSSGWVERIVFQC